MKKLFRNIICLGVPFLLASCGGAPETDPGNNEKKTPADAETFVMEAEYVDLTGIVGGGNSCEKRECGMIYGEGTETEINDFGWSSGYFVAYTHKAGVKFSFNFTSDRAVDDASLVIRMASEMGAVSFGPDAFEIKLNGTAIDYEEQYLSNYPVLENMRFQDKTISNKISLLEGDNVLTLEILTNNLNGTGTIGPIIDCVKITSKAVLSWEPKTDNPDHRGDI